MMMHRMALLSIYSSPHASYLAAADYWFAAHDKKLMIMFQCRELCYDALPYSHPSRKTLNREGLRDRGHPLLCMSPVSIHTDFPQHNTQTSHR